MSLGVNAGDAGDKYIAKAESYMDAPDLQSKGGKGDSGGGLSGLISGVLGMFGIHPGGKDLPPVKAPDAAATPVVNGGQTQALQSSDIQLPTLSAPTPDLGANSPFKLQLPNIKSLMD